MRSILLAVAIGAFSTGCATTSNPQAIQDASLQKFAYANCLMWYFESKGFDSEDIRAISGGIVETSDISLEVFQEIALTVKDYQPNLQTKHGIDINLLRCFHLDESEKLIELYAK